MIQLCRQLKDNGVSGRIRMPDSFIDHEKLRVWMKLRHHFSGDGDLKHDIDLIWVHWSRCLSEKEARQEEEARRLEGETEDETRTFLAPTPCPPTPARTPGPMTPAPTPGHRPSVLARTPTPCPPTPSRTPTPGPSRPASRTPYPLTPLSSAGPWTPLSAGTPGTPFQYDHDEDRIIDRINIKIESQGKMTGDVFSYGRKESKKVVCMTDCTMKNAEKHKVKVVGVTLQTLKNHARKHHQIDLNIKEKRATVTEAEGITCKHCSQVFSRPQTLRQHIKKIHARDNSDQTPVQQQPPPLLPVQRPAQRTLTFIDSPQSSLHSLPPVHSSPPLHLFDDAVSSIDDLDLSSVMSPGEIQTVVNLIDFDHDSQIMEMLSSGNSN